MRQFGTLVNPFTVEYIAQGVINERSSDGSLTIFTLDNSNPNTIDAWLATVRTAILNWPVNRPCYSLHDIRKASQSAFGARLLARFMALPPLRQELDYAVAFVVGDEAHDEKICFNWTDVEVGFDYNYKIFSTRNQAFAWLLRELKGLD